MPDINKSLEKFYNLAPQVVLTVDSKGVAKRMDAINKKYGINISPLIIHVFSDELEIDNIPQYLQRELDLDKKTAQEVFDEINNKILEPVKERIYFLDPNPAKKTIGMEREKEILLHIFEKKLTKELRKHFIIKYCVNKQIFYALKDSMDFQKELEKALYKNEERISDGSIELKGESVPSTVANWIKHFIEEEGSEIFDNMQLSRFVSTNKDAKKLKDNEKEMLIKVLKTYRNIKYFPDSMPSDDSSDWEILPLDEKPSNEKKKEKDGFSDTTQSASSSVSEKISSSGSEKQESVPNSSSTEDPRIQELEEQKREYPEGSLERRAIEEEIKKLQNS